MARAQLWRLHGKLHTRISERTFNHLGAMPDNGDGFLRIQCGGSGNHMAHHRLPGDRMQYFRQPGAHARALTCCENNDLQRTRMTQNQLRLIAFWNTLKDTGSPKTKGGQSRPFVYLNHLV